jgi:hypothetical protein
LIDPKIRARGKVDDDWVRILNSVPFVFTFGSWAAAANIAWGSWTIFTIILVGLVVLAVFSMLRDEEKNPRRIQSFESDNDYDRRNIEELKFNLVTGTFVIGLTLFITTVLYLTIWWGHHLRMAEIYLCVFGVMSMEASYILRAIHKRNRGVI